MHKRKKRKFRRIYHGIGKITEDNSRGFECGYRGGYSWDTTFVDDLGADSLDIFQIVMGIEEEFDIEIPTEEVEQIVSVGDAVEQIKRLIG